MIILLKFVLSSYDCRSHLEERIRINQSSTLIILRIRLYAISHSTGAIVPKRSNRIQSIFTNTIVFVKRKSVCKTRFTAKSGGPFCKTGVFTSKKSRLRDDFRGKT
jgi:hypothetical protein